MSMCLKESFSLVHVPSARNAILMYLVSDASSPCFSRIGAVHGALTVDLEFLVLALLTAVPLALPSQ